VRAGTVMTRRLTMGAATAATLAVLLAGSAMAQGQGRSVATNTPNALQGFSQNRNQPINIVSNSLEVRDKEKIATFIDNVKLTQGDTILETKRLIVYYDEQTPVGSNARRGPSAPGGSGQNIRRLEAKGGVVVTQKDQTAVGDEGVYDMKTNSVTLTGKVVVTQGPNTITGTRLWVDLATGTSRVESGGPGGVSAIFNPNSAPQAPAPPSRGQAPGAPTNNRAAPQQSPRTQPDRSRQHQSASEPMRLQR
jgi:lipopolysaccharide export system protein LptA